MTGIGRYHKLIARHTDYFVVISSMPKLSATLKSCITYTISPCDEALDVAISRDGAKRMALPPYVPDWDNVAAWKSETVVDKFLYALGRPWVRPSPTRTMMRRGVVTYTRTVSTSREQQRVDVPQAGWQYLKQPKSQDCR